jgi:dolichol-phosphate mannosyltransferase
MGSQQPELSVVVPAFNEEANVETMHRRLVAALDDVVESLEILFVDDGSSDATWSRVRDLAASDGRVRGIRFARNFGHQAALTAGVDAAKGRAVVIIDGDLQDPPEVIPEMVARWREGFEVVYGQREER